MFARWFCQDKKKSRKHQEDIAAHTSKLLTVTGHPVSNEVIDKKEDKKKMILVSPENLNALVNLVKEGWKTTGDAVTISNKDYLYYFLEDSSDDMKVSVPTSPTYDAKAEFKWKRVPVEESEQFQNQGWMARSVCPQTNRIWLCLKK